MFAFSFKIAQGISNLPDSEKAKLGYNPDEFLLDCQYAGEYCNASRSILFSSLFYFRMYSLQSTNKYIVAQQFYSSFLWQLCSTLKCQFVSIFSDFVTFYNAIHGNCYIFNSGWKGQPTPRISYKTGRRYGKSRLRKKITTVTFQSMTTIILCAIQ